jgi:hypothetical protein
MILVASFANSIKTKSFDGSNFKRWRDLITLWLTTLNVTYVISGTALEGVLPEAFQAVNSLFRGAVISIMADNLIDTYLHYKTGKRSGRFLRLSLEFLI